MEHLSAFQIIALLILILFYSIYLGKMLLQRKKGILTNQIARGKKKGSLLKVELIMKIATYSIIIVELLSIGINTATPYSFLRTIGAILGTIGIIIFATAIYTMRDSWRAGVPETDKTELVTNGIFKLSRNPAFLAFYLVYTSILLMFFNWVLLAFTVWSIIMLHLQIKQEEQFLLSTFGNQYTKYKKTTRRYL